ncbi:MAG: hypothetical protein RMJ98_06535 [Myxococcales bacterium]|nr:hypothetical protein [Polyangiaceae bacterium]MDW8248942.1 hypothetical protein [Myxococcales bacterium]
MSEENPPPSPTPLVPAPRPAAVRYETCPHCGNSTLLEPSPAFGFRCGVCGKARVPINLPGFERSNAEIPALARASACHTAALAWTTGSVVLGAFSLVGLGSLALVLTVLNPGLIPVLFGLLITLIPAGLAVHGFRRAARLRAQVAPALEEGWLRVVREISDAQGSISDVRLAEILQIDRERAAQLLAQLAATSEVRHRLDEAPLTFESPRLRVESPANEAPRDTENRMDKDAEEEHDLEAIEAAKEKSSREFQA